MTVTVPAVPTYAAGEKLTVADMTAKIRDPIAWLMNPPSAKARVSAQAITSSASAWTLVGLDAEDYDWSVEAMHDATTLNSRVYCPANGLYEVEVYIVWAAPVGAYAGARGFHVRANAGGSSAGGSSVMTPISPSAAGAAGVSFYQAATWRVRRTAGDYLEAFVRQSQAETLNVNLYLGLTWVAV